MPAISFRREWIDDLLSGKKRQTTRAPSPPGKPARIKEGDVCNLYCEQRVPIWSKPFRSTTMQGREVMERLSQDPTKNYPPVASANRQYPAHFLGKVEITEVYEICPAEMDDAALAGWAKLDGFDSFDLGDMWFVRHYSESWLHRTWLAIRWDGWLARHFGAGAV